MVSKDVCALPKLRVAYLEAGCGWLPYMMDRMDEEMEKPYRVQAPLLKQKPSEMDRNGQIWTTCEVEEKPCRSCFSNSIRNV